MRTNPYGQALTLEEWRIASELKGRPLTDDPMKSRHAMQDARLSRLVQPTPRKRTPTPEEAAVA